MAVVKELIRTEENGGISFGNYELPTKSKASGTKFPHDGSHPVEYPDGTG